MSTAATSASNIAGATNTTIGCRAWWRISSSARSGDRRDQRAGGRRGEEGDHHIPIVFETGLDPVAAGLVNSLGRPGGNVTGVTQMNIGLTPKRFEFLRELLPNAKLVALMVNPNDGRLAKTTVDESEEAAKTFGFRNPRVQRDRRQRL